MKGKLDFMIEFAKKSQIYFAHSIFQFSKIDHLHEISWQLNRILYIVIKNIIISKMSVHFKFF